nr:tyrosine-type recombinase/integrase [uncultured Campylobacter sp.]
MTLNELFKNYLEYYELILSPSTLRSDVATYQKHFKDGLGLKNVNEINFIDVQKFCNDLIKKDYKIKTVKNILAKLKVVFKLALKLEIINKNPCDLIELPKFDNKRYFDYSVAIQKKFIKAISENKEPSADIFFFLLHGRRKNEVLSLKFSDINFKTRTYTIPFKINKAKRDMVYKMSDELYDRLYKRYINFKRCGLVDDFVFKNPMTNSKYQDLRKSWRSLLSRNSLPLIRLHDIRHLIGTYSINYLKIPVEQVSFTLGHTNIITTQKYITANVKKSKETIEILLSSV